MEEAKKWWRSLSMHEMKIYLKRHNAMIYWGWHISEHLIWSMYSALDDDVKRFYQKRSLIVNRNIAEFIAGS